MRMFSSVSIILSEICKLRIAPFYSFVLSWLIFSMCGSFFKFLPPTFCIRVVYFSHSYEKINFCALILILIFNFMEYEMFYE